MGACLSSSAAVESAEREKENGKNILRELASRDVIDWKAVIETADALHAKEQAQLRRKTLFPRKKWAYNYARNRQEHIGAFSVNVSTYQISTEETHSRNSHDDHCTLATESIVYRSRDRFVY
mmetsp:Transcript_6565/g.9563  ORF Transcript_6565/g.9563 Transcript_6565/m.9563 type:complete len:122 (-) Transcript_6565:578-943(-)